MAKTREKRLTEDTTKKGHCARFMGICKLGVPKHPLKSLASTT